MIVAKFGGTSMGSAIAMGNCAAIVRDRPEYRVVVVSATSGTTNQLGQLASELGRKKEIVASIQQRHLELARELELPSTVDLEIREYCEQLLEISCNTPAAKDFILSRGEKLSSVIFCALLEKMGRTTEVLPAESIIQTDSNFGQARPSLDECKRLGQNLCLDTPVVTQGFVGQDSEGHITTLGRGGSDYSAALFAEALDASEIHIWTDVSGVYSTDPRKLPSAQRLRELNYNEAAELANFGAKVLHPATLGPAERAGIPILIASSLDANGPGTWVRKSVDEAPSVRAIAKRENQKLLTVTSPKMVGVHGFLAKLFTILAKHELSVDLVTTSEVSVALTLDGNHNGCGGEVDIAPALLEELRTFAKVKIEDELSLVAVIGNNMATTAGLACRTFRVLDDYNMRMLSHGASSHNICFLVRRDEANAIVERLHRNLIEVAE